MWRQNFEVYGVYRAWRQLNREGFAVVRCTVARLTTKMCFGSDEIFQRKADGIGDPGSGEADSEGLGAGAPPTGC